MSASKNRQVLATAKKLAKSATSWIELHNELFGMGGVVSATFPTEADRTAFSKSAECKEIYDLFDQLRDEKGDPPIRELGDKLTRANGALSVRVPRSIHAALLLEAESEGVSLNQLCLAKLSVQLRSVV